MLRKALFISKRSDGLLQDFAVFESDSDRCRDKGGKYIFRLLCSSRSDNKGALMPCEDVKLAVAELFERSSW